MAVWQQALSLSRKRRWACIIGRFFCGDVMKYRSEIDGLRAIAVLPVVLFHAGIKSFSGGFVGVDIFFVISGYLITSIIRDEIEHGQFSLVRFYERRARRILPALLAVIAFAGVAAYCLFIPDDFAEFGRSVAGTMAFATNILFWNETGYFDSTSELRPLLHTWSLAVEEQFYILLPILLITTSRLSRGRLSACVAALALTSFAVSAWSVSAHPEAAFYLLHSRAWELLIGSFLALGVLPPLGERARLSARFGGLTLIGFSIFTYTAKTPFPGASALLPCIGAALLIHAGGGGNDPIIRLLRSRPMVFVGLISYSLYLWHWPLLVLARYYNVVELELSQTALVLAATGLVAYASWRYVETPFRKMQLKRAVLLTAVPVGMVCVLAIGLLINVSKGLPSRMSPEAQKMAEYKRSRNPRTKECFRRPRAALRLDQCFYGPAGAPQVVVWGDSHADAAVTAIGELASSHSVPMQSFIAGSCRPILGLTRRDIEACLAYNNQIMEYLTKGTSIETVIMIARWSFPLKGSTDDLGPAERERKVPFIDENGMPIPDAELEALYRKKITETVAMLRRAGRKVVLVYPIPETGYNIPGTIARIVQSGRDPHVFTRPYDYYRKRHDTVFDIFSTFKTDPGVVHVYPHKRFCDEHKCIVYADGAPLYYDDDHLSLDGGRHLAPLLEPVFDELAQEAMHSG
jgi:peptidoglycan/LPS O-acetylase OafA/YrhL